MSVERRLEGWARSVVESKFCTVFMLLLTLFALTGDDLRLLCTNRPMDDVYNFLTLFCIAAFSLEIILCVWGKEDYFLSFFFFLDVISTASLVLDLTWVSDEMLGDEDDVNELKGSRTAKTGARLSRVVRVIRLIRIVKLYKGLLEARMRRQKTVDTLDPGENDWRDMHDFQVGKRRESRVGKKLSELTVRRVICLVVLMMIMQRLLRIDTAMRFPTSATFGADTIHEAFMRMEEDPEDPSLRARYDDLMLRYMYYHSWFTGHKDDCPVKDRSCSKDYESQLFWVGIMSTDSQLLEQKARLAQISSEAARLWQERVGAMTSQSAPWDYNFGVFPPDVSATMGMRWDMRCRTQTGTFERLGLSFLSEELTDWGLNFVVRCPEDLRRGERRKYSPRLNVTQAEFQTWHFAFYFDLRPFVGVEAEYSMLVTLFVCVSLCIASLVFANDANRLVVHPVEDMIAKVEAIRDNPITAVKVADAEFKADEERRAKRAERRSKSLHGGVRDRVRELWCRALSFATKQRESAFAPMPSDGHMPKATSADRDRDKHLMETAILERTIVKLGSLLALGFGEAGANIIGQNMHGANTAAIDAMVEGTRVECVIGVARIREFSTATEVLQANVMAFVNQIAEIVHGVADGYHGYTSRNNGGVFLVIWRMRNFFPEERGKLADMSMMAFTQILIAIHKSPVLAAYRGHPGLKMRLGSDCRVNLSCALHFGWAIEGAVGSEFKIDASYLSPNVSVAEGVERATKIYGVSLLITEFVVQICTRMMAGNCRLIDRVKIAGSDAPMKLYTIDMDLLSLSVEDPASPRQWNPRQRFRVRQLLEAEKAARWHENVHIPDVFASNQDVRLIRQRFTLKFVHTFNMGYQNYAQGEWEVARGFLSRAREIVGIDEGPSIALLRYMEAYGGIPPKDWANVRDLCNDSQISRIG